LGWETIGSEGNERLVQGNKKGSVQIENQVEFQDIIDLGGASFLLEHNNSLSQLLTQLYPEFRWNFNLNESKSLHYKKSQFLLKTMLKTIFPHQGKFIFVTVTLPQKEVFFDYKHPDIVTHAGYPLELDFFYPQLQIAVEYQVTQVNRSPVIVL
jgi:hypothetical protein